MCTSCSWYELSCSAPRYAMSCLKRTREIGQPPGRMVGSLSVQSSVAPQLATPSHCASRSLHASPNRSSVQLGMPGSSNGSSELPHTGSPQVWYQRSSLGQVNWQVPLTQVSSAQDWPSGQRGHAPTPGQSSSTWHELPPSVAVPASTASSGHANCQRLSTHTASPQ